jgi:hypothetical protein
VLRGCDPASTVVRNSPCIAVIDANRGDFGVECLGRGVLLVFGAPCQFRSLAEQEQGRTIPLAAFAYPFSCLGGQDS